ncbi:MAG: flagellar export protein FliJ [Hyphomicrobium sp.]
MKSRETAIRAKRFEVDEKARKAADLEHMIREFENMAVDLDRQIRAEEDRTGIKDPAHFAYSTFAKSAGQRRDNLLSSAAELRAKFEAALRERDEAEEQFARVAAPEQPASPLSSSRRRSERHASAVLR